MLLKNLSNKMTQGKAAADIARANAGEKVTAGGLRDRPSPKKRRIVPTQAQTFSPTALDGLTDGFVTTVVRAQDDTPEPKRHNEGYLHLSAILKSICQRQVRFSDENPDKKVYDNVTGGHRVMWKLGRAVESHIRESYIKGVKGEGVYGVWECDCRALSKTGFYDATWAECGRCRKKANTYKEFTVYDHEAGVVGNPDFLIDIGGVMYIVEIKSMNPEDYDALAAPLPDHIYQAAGYRRLMNGNDFDVAPQVIIVYCTKKFKFGSPYKEFHVDVDKEGFNNVLDGAWTVAAHVRESRRKGTIPAERVCKNASSPMARNCPHVTDCMQGNL